MFHFIITHGYSLITSTQLLRRNPTYINICTDTHTDHSTHIHKDACHLGTEVHTQMHMGIHKTHIHIHTHTDININVSIYFYMCWFVSLSTHPTTDLSVYPPLHPPNQLSLLRYQTKINNCS